MQIAFIFGTRAAHATISMGKCRMKKRQSTCKMRRFTSIRAHCWWRRTFDISFITILQHIISEYIIMSHNFCLFTLTPNIDANATHSFSFTFESLWFSVYFVVLLLSASQLESPLFFFFLTRFTFLIWLLFEKKIEAKNTENLLLHQTNDYNAIISVTRFDAFVGPDFLRSVTHSATHYFHHLNVERMSNYKSNKISFFFCSRSMQSFI